MIRAMAAAAMLAAIATPALATDWQGVTVGGKKGDPALFIVDRDSIRADGPNRQADMFLVSPDIYVQMTMRIDCQGRRWQPVRARVVVNGNETREGEGVWDDVPAGSAHETVMNYVCSGGSAPGAINVAFGSADPVAPARAWLHKLLAAG